MNTELSVEELIDPLQTVIGVVEKKQSLPILSHVLIQLKDQGPHPYNNRYGVRNQRIKQDKKHRRRLILQFMQKTS